MSSSFHPRSAINYYSDSGLSTPRNRTDKVGSSKNDATANSGNISKLSVSVRVRPVIYEDKQLANTIRNEPELCVHLKQDGQSIKLLQDKFHAKSFKVDRTFPSTSTQSEVYNHTLKPVVKDVIKGYNGTGIVYGQTASGKTYTMFGSQQRVGIAHHALEDLYQVVRELEDRHIVAKIFLSFYQIYLEQIYDLLADPVDFRVMPNPLAIRENNNSVYIENLKSIYCRDQQSAYEVIALGLRHRKVHSTNFNLQSSRSHAILEIQLDTEETNGPNGNQTEQFEEEKSHQNGNIVNNDDDDDFNFNAEEYMNRQKQVFTKHKILRRKLLLVDLAGSERIPIYRNTNKQQMKESSIINKSISALGNVITALCNNNWNSSSSGNNLDTMSVSQHIPYRDCKLTRVLASSLGGNSKTCIICTIGPCMYNYEETKSTLKFASRAKIVKKIVKKNPLTTIDVPIVTMPEVDQLPENGNFYSDNNTQDSRSSPRMSSNHSVGSVSTTSAKKLARPAPSTHYEDHFNSSSNPFIQSPPYQNNPGAVPGVSRIPSNSKIIVNSEFVGTRSPISLSRMNSLDSNLSNPRNTVSNPQEFYNDNLSNKYTTSGKVYNNLSNIVYEDDHPSSFYNNNIAEPPTILQPSQPNTFNVRDFIRACTIAHRLYTPQEHSQMISVDSSNRPTGSSHQSPMSNSSPQHSRIFNIQPISPPIHKSLDEFDAMNQLGVTMIDYESTPTHQSPDITVSHHHRQPQQIHQPNESKQSHSNQEEYPSSHDGYQSRLAGSIDGAKHSFHLQSPVMLLVENAPHLSTHSVHEDEHDNNSHTTSSAHTTPKHQQQQQSGRSKSIGSQTNIIAQQTNENIFSLDDFRSHHRPSTIEREVQANMEEFDGDDNINGETPLGSLRRQSASDSNYLKNEINDLLENRRELPSTKLHLMKIAQQNPALLVEELLRVKQEVSV